MKIDSNHVSDTWRRQRLLLRLKCRLFRAAATRDVDDSRIKSGLSRTRRWQRVYYDHIEIVLRCCKSPPRNGTPHLPTFSVTRPPNEVANHSLREKKQLVCGVLYTIHNISELPPSRHDAMILWRHLQTSPNANEEDSACAASARATNPLVRSNPLHNALSFPLETNAPCVLQNGGKGGDFHVLHTLYQFLRPTFSPSHLPFDLHPCFVTSANDSKSDNVFSKYCILLYRPLRGVGYTDTVLTTYIRSFWRLAFREQP